MELEKPWGAVVQFGGQTAIKLAKALTDMGVPILGTSADGVDAAEDRERFDEILKQVRDPQSGRPYGLHHRTRRWPPPMRVGYPVLVRPSYVLGGQGMEIAYNDQDIVEFMKIINMTVQEHPILVDKYLMGREVEVDGVFDGEDVLIPGIMEHVERAGIHSGDSIAVYPPLHIDEIHKETILKHTRNLAKAPGRYRPDQCPVHHLQRHGVCHRGQPPFLPYHPLYLQGHRRAHHRPGHQGHAGRTSSRIWATARASIRRRTISPCKMPVFSFEKLTDVDINLGPEMKSTGEMPGHCRVLSSGAAEGLQGCQHEGAQEGRVASSSPSRTRTRARAVGVARELNDLGVELSRHPGYL